MESGKLILFYADDLYKIFCDKKESIIASVKRLTEIHNKALGIDKVEDYKDFLANAPEYIVNAYWNAHCQNMAQHLNKEVTFENQTGILVSEINKAWEYYKSEFNSCKNLHGYDRTPIVLKSGVRFKITRENFARYLDESKRKHYEADVALLDAVNGVLPFNTNNGIIHLVRFQPQYLQISGNSTLEINLNHFVTPF